MNQTLTELTLAPMNREHLASVLTIERDIYPFPWTLGNFADSIKAGYDALIIRSDAACESDSAGALIGYAVLMHILDEVHLLNISVAGQFQRGGLGRRALRQLMDRAARSGSRGMFLEVRPSNEAALNLYESEGFLRIGLRRNYYPSYDRSREDAIVMRRALSV